MKALVTLLLAALGIGASATIAVAEDGGAVMAAETVLERSPVVHPERYPKLGPAPVPMPEQPTARLVVTGLDGEVIVDAVPFDAHGTPSPEAFAQISRAFRANQGDEKPIDPRLVEVLLLLSQAFDGKPVALVSAHRVAGRSTRKTSYHTRGMAADIAIRGVRVHDIVKAARRLGATGVGVYPSFVHIDVRRDRPAYRWVGGSVSGWRRARR